MESFMKINITILIQHIAEQFNQIYEQPQEQEQVAWWLLQAIVKKTKAELIAQKEIELSKDEDYHLKKVINEHRVELKPLQYIIGWVPFLDLHIFVESPVLIPRPETEEWTAKLIEQLKKLPEKNISILDLATGSGCIALALGKNFPDARILATDISEQALNLAHKNAKYNKIHNVEFIKSNVYTSIPHKYKFDLIVSNPPYISQTEWETLSPMVRKWEDKKALTATQEGLSIIHEIINGAYYYLKKDKELNQYKIPQLLIEIGYQQGQAVKNLMEQASFIDVIIHKDLEGKDRVVTGGLSA
jgi:release factor glutamine methyltransferase